MFSKDTKRNNYMLKEAGDNLVDDRGHVILNYDDFFPSSMEAPSSQAKEQKQNQPSALENKENSYGVRSQSKRGVFISSQDLVSSPEASPVKSPQKMQDPGLGRIDRPNMPTVPGFRGNVIKAKIQEKQEKQDQETFSKVVRSAKPALRDLKSLKSSPSPSVTCDDPEREPFIQSPYFKTPHRKSPPKSINTNLEPSLLPQGVPGSQLTKLSSQSLSWSSSPDFHQKETLASIQNKRDEHDEHDKRGKHDKRDKIQHLISPVKSSTANKKHHADYLLPGRNGQTRFRTTTETTSDQKKDAYEATDESIHDSKDAAVNKVEDAEKPKDSTALLPAVFLSVEQRKILEIVLQGESVFFTGSAGTGKSVLLRRIIADLTKKYDPRKVGVTASTGLAAYNIGGATLHSFTGIGLGKEDVDTLYKKIRRHRTKLGRWKNLKILIIDEVSMVDGELFDKLEALARKIRRNEAPFGGIQLVITGDFFQLPPVAKNDEVMKFAFEAETWNHAIPNTLLLEQVFRQKDNRFSTMLNEMRRGVMSRGTVEIFQKLTRPPVLPHGLTPTEIYPRRFEVEHANSVRLNSLKTQSVEFVSMDHYQTQEYESRALLENLMAMPVIKLKVGAQVMMIKNIDETLVNGSLGKVVGFMSESAFKYVKKVSPRIMDSWLASSSDQHEPGEVLTQQASQDYGLNRDGYESENTEDEGEDEDYSVFAIPDDWEELEQNGSNVNWRRKIDRLKQLYDNMKSKGDIWPLVRFVQTNGTTRDVLCHPETWKFEDPVNNSVIASRTQIPLILAWALSIHKSQGQTLEYLKVNLNKVFEKGQAYVAVSRAVSLDGLQVIGFHPHKVMVHPKVLHFYDDLDNVFHLDDKRELKEKEKEKDSDEKQMETEEAFDDMYAYPGKDSAIAVDYPVLAVDTLYSKTPNSDVAGKKCATPLEQQHHTVAEIFEPSEPSRRSSRNLPKVSYAEPGFSEMDADLDPEFQINQQHAFM